jgi:hypothetical protein
MIPINNSDTAWLIVTDYNQDNGKFHEELREDVLDPDVHQWVYEHGDKDKVGSYSNYCMVGEDIIDIATGILGGALVGDGGSLDTLAFNSNLVGGNVANQ